MKIFAKTGALLVAMVLFHGQCFAQTASTVNDETAAKTQENVPVECAAFLGSWTGNWAYGNYGEMRLQVVDVDNACNAKGAYGQSEGVVRLLKNAQVKEGKLTWVCYPSREGTCIFERNGDVLRAQYSEPSGGRNSATFKKVVN